MAGTRAVDRQRPGRAGLGDLPRAVASRWFNGSADITTYDLDELLGTKLRALYQRRKGRDLYDMATALSRGAVDPARIVAAFRRYMSEGGHAVTRSEFEDNLSAKMEDKRFLSDIPPLLAADRSWDAPQAAALVVERLFLLL
jgi:predicted nucleotidyltransferase component of viral defense system